MGVFSQPLSTSLQGCISGGPEPPSFYLRQGKSTRRPRAGGVDRRSQIPEMASIHLRPPEVEDRSMPGHCEGAPIEGKANASAVDTLNERSGAYRMLMRKAAHR